MDDNGEYDQDTSDHNTQLIRKSPKLNRQYTIPPKEALDLSKQLAQSSDGYRKLVLSASDVVESLEGEQGNENTSMLPDSSSSSPPSPPSQHDPHPIASGSLRISASNLTTGTKKTKGSVLQASVEFGIGGISLSPTIPPITIPPSPPANLEKSASQRVFSRFHGLFSSSDTTPPPSPSSSSVPLPSPSGEEQPGFFKKLTTRLTSSAHTTAPMQHNFHSEINMLLPPPQPPSASASNLIKIIHEIIATEWEYLGDLIALSDIQNLMLTHHVVEQGDAARIFGNVDQILMANLELYRTFQKNEWNCKESTEHADIGVLATNIAEAFVAIAAYLRMYAAYSSKHEDSLKLIKTLSARTDFKIFLVQLAKQPVCKNLALQGLLIKPIQRVCKYPLLLRELLKYVDDPITRPQIETAMAKIEETLLKVNEHQKMADRVEKMAKVLQELLDGGVDVEALNLASRRFISQGSLHTSLSGKTKDGQYYLFHDLFLWTRKGLSSIKIETNIPLKEALVVDISPPVPGGHPFPFFFIFGYL